ncbi:uncharacterized protein LOC106665837 [Cimex lectularius]|uniref:Uncharacterized protein n=1 Tax=Cimex lectularius TaxID=79782 RepID=A0A8I6RQK1_CIMLE|nr:uncharacterized protein LOC106665837 [Cimex lectularius]
MHFLSTNMRLLVFSKITRFAWCQFVERQSVYKSPQFFNKCSTYCDPPALESEFKSARDNFLKLEVIRESVVDFDLLTDEEKIIHDAHKTAVSKWHFTYEDPFDKVKVYTRYRHTLLGRCCGTACRHCVFNYYNVPELLKKNKKFNSSFWAVKDPNMNTAIEIFKDLKVADNVIRGPIF